MSSVIDMGWSWRSTGTRRDNNHRQRQQNSLSNAPNQDSTENMSSNNSTRNMQNDPQLLETHLHTHRRASSDCCLHQIDGRPHHKLHNTSAVDSLVDMRLPLRTSNSSSSTGVNSISRPVTPLAISRPNSPLLGALLQDLRRAVSPTSSSDAVTPTSSLRPVTPVLGSSSTSYCPQIHPHCAHLHPLHDLPGNRSSSRASVPEILVSDDYGSPSSSTGSSPLSGDSGLEGGYTLRKKNHEDLHQSSSRRRSPMTGRRGVGTEGGTNTPPTSSSSSGTTPLQGRARAHTSVPLSGTSVSSPFTDDIHSSNEDGDLDGGGMSSAISNGSGDGADILRGGSTDTADEADSSRPGQQHLADRMKELSEALQAKMLKTRDLIKQEQKARDDNVNEYLKCAASADKLQISRIKAVFEKKNQKSATSIQHLQKKLDTYQKRLLDLQTHGLATQHRQPKEVLRDMGQGLKSGLISKPREFAHLLKNKFGSVDNIKEILSDEDRDEEKTHHGSATLPPGVSLSSISPNTVASATAAVATNCILQQSATASQILPININSSGGGGHHSGGGGGGGSSGGGGGSGGGVPSEEDSECNSSLTSESIPGLAHHTHHLHHHQHLASPRAVTNQNFCVQDGSGVDLGGYLAMEHILSATHETRSEMERLREEIDTIKSAFLVETSALHERLNEERTRVEQLEQQVNDLTELHQNEMENLKTTMTDMEEKVQYQSEERVRDLQEMLENYHTRISRMEHQQAQQQQQFLTLEGLENSNARALFVKLINILLTILQVLLLMVATAMNIVAPLLQTRGRLITTILVLFVCVFLYIQMPDLKESFWTLTGKYSWLMSW
ncbi:transmembrane and coiled-coil domains protein 1 isoform X2 [Hyalella azteca]|uniref:Transmembrane and coiled-coil domains protein 1 isoform X2 n=1 Tax=Hyalella azteca TaxID=294128 RepID=A0A8B7NWN7_HYAAZ|nr:transmembrane and coiled-coil domains protein 1 isoform X2 [Hyalella azteca]